MATALTATAGTAATDTADMAGTAATATVMRRPTATPRPTTATPTRRAASIAAITATDRSEDQTAPGCGRAATAGTSSAQRTAMSRRARLRWRRSRRAGDGRSAVV